MCFLVKSILDQRILERFSVIRQEREGNSDSENDRVTSRPSQDLLKSDIIHPSSPAPKRKLPSTISTSPSVIKKPRPQPVKKDRHDTERDAKLAAQLHEAINSTPVRKTRGAASGTKVKPRSKKIKIKNGEDNGDEPPKKKRAPNPNSAFNAPKLLSQQLADVVHETELSRPVFPPLPFPMFEDQN